MSRWIDIDAVIYEHWHDDGYDTFVYCTDLENAPSIGICFCRGCKYHTSDDECTNPHWDSGQDLYPKAMEYDFCSYGEREGE